MAAPTSDTVDDAALTALASSPSYSAQPRRARSIVQEFPMFGGLAIHLFLSSVSDGWAQLGGMGEVIGFFAFGALNVFIVIKGSESIKWLETLAAPLLLIVGAGLIWWASDKV